MCLVLDSVVAFPHYLRHVVRTAPALTTTFMGWVRVRVRASA